MREIKRVVVHHTGSILGRFDSPWLVRARHKYIRGFDDIGYHYLIGNGVITGEGRLYNGRPVEAQGAHAWGYNPDSIGISLIGNFDRKKPTDKQLENLINFLVENCKKFNIPTNEIYAHNELDKEKACPGRFVDMQEIRRKVEVLLREKEEDVAEKNGISKERGYAVKEGQILKY